MSGAISRHLLRLRRSVPLPTLKQGTTLSIRSAIPNLSVKVESGWRDDGQATLVQRLEVAQQELAADMTIVEEVDQVTSLGRSESHVSISLEPSADWECFEDEESTIQAEEETLESPAVTLQVPEKVNLICELDQGGNVEVTNKIEGDVRLTTSNGDIRVKKLRGHTLELETRQEGYIYASDLLEAQKLNINLHEGGRLRVKRIHGDAVDIRVGSASSTEERRGDNNPMPEQLDDDDEGSVVDISSMYVSGTGGAQIALEEGLKPPMRGVRVKSHHGPVVVNAEGVHKPSRGDCPLVELGSVNGSCEISVRGVNTTDESSNDWVACQVHYDSISPESVSLITSDTGNIGLTIDRKLEADMRLLSALEDTTSIGKKASLLADDDDSEQVLRILAGGESESTTTEASRISIETESFTERTSYVSSDHQTEYVEGWVENKSHEPDSRFEMKTRRGAAGKIRLTGAANQALQNFSSPVDDSTTDATTRPLIVAAGVGKVTLETLSWLGAIARRYGLDEKGRELGRQATRRGRVILPADE